jgi:acyl-CoA synthetase (AMP-forming)/AMP-acid ligase II
MAPSSTLIEIADGLGAYAERPALVAFGARERREWSYGHLARNVRELAAGLASAGLEPGARVALFAPDGPEWIASALAAIRAGAVVVPLDAQFTDEVLAHTLIDRTGEACRVTRASARSHQPRRPRDGRLVAREHRA